MPVAADLACAIHVHSTYSDGTGSVAQIAAAGARAGVDAVLLTDHDTLEARRRGEERWYGPTLVCVGHEISPKGGNHVLAFGVEEEIPWRGRSSGEILAALRAAGGFGFLAHPFSQGSERFRRARGMPWDDLEDERIAGIELWSMVTDTAEGLRSLREVARFVARPERVLDRPPPRNMDGWDRLTARRPVVAIGGIDAHQIGLRVAGRVPLRLMAYHRSFRHLRTRVLLERPPSGDAEADRDAIFDALRRGRCYLAVDSLAPARGFRFEAAGAAMGEEIEAGPPVTLSVSAPRPAHLVLLRDGVEVASRYGAELEHDAAEPGVYRVEATLPRHGRERTWVISNPIYVR